MSNACSNVMGILGIVSNRSIIVDLFLSHTFNNEEVFIITHDHKSYPHILFHQNIFTNLRVVRQSTRHQRAACDRFQETLI